MGTPSTSTEKEEVTSEIAEPETMEESAKDDDNSEEDDK
jgi:hypothetical protein